MESKSAPKKKLSVLKRARQSLKRNERNTAVRSKLKTLRKYVIEAVDAKDAEKVEKAIKAAVRAFSSAASKGVIHRNTASRNISRLTKLADTVLKAKAA